MNLKIQLPDKITGAAFINQGILSDFNKGRCLTFHAFSDTMKARVLEMIAQGEKVTVSVTNEAPKTGEWMEEIQK